MDSMAKRNYVRPAPVVWTILGLRFGRELFLGAVVHLLFTLAYAWYVGRWYYVLISVFFFLIIWRIQVERDQIARDKQWLREHHLSVDDDV